MLHLRRGELSSPRGPTSPSERLCEKMPPGGLIVFQVVQFVASDKRPHIPALSS
jgi:hypothetical protein